MIITPQIYYNFAEQPKDLVMFKNNLVLFFRL